MEIKLNLTTITMKKLLILSASMIMTSWVFAQSKNDPTYSIHNYKQPNKATEAAQMMNNSQAFTYKNEVATDKRNYKNQQNKENSGGVLIATVPVEVNVNNVFSNQNYKSSFGKRAINNNNLEMLNSGPMAKSCGRCVDKKHQNFVKKSVNYKSQF